MSILLDWLSGLLILMGGLLCVTGGVGLLRLPDFFSRVHAAGVTETLATPMLLLGLMLQMEWSLDTFKAFMIMVLILATNPTATHSMAKAALIGGKRPLVKKQANQPDNPGEEISKT